MKSILLLVALILSAHAADLPRVAVVPDSQGSSVAAFADFLSVSLASASNEYALVERAELTRLASEAEVQKLAADQRPAALAKLAMADGLIILSADKGDPKQPKLTLRLTSSNNGWSSARSSSSAARKTNTPKPPNSPPVSPPRDPAARPANEPPRRPFAFPRAIHPPHSHECAYVAQT